MILAYIIGFLNFIVLLWQLDAGNYGAAIVNLISLMFLCGAEWFYNRQRGDDQ